MADLILGTAALGGIAYGGKPAIEYSEAKALIKRAYSLGIRTFETSSFYGEAFSWLLYALDAHVAMIYLKTDDEKDSADIEVLRSTLDQHRIVRLLHHYTGGPLPGWTAGFSCYSHDGIKSASGMIVQQDWNLLNQSTWPEGCSYKMARSVFLRGALAHNRAQRTLALKMAMQHADGVVVGPRSIAELEELVDISNLPDAPGGLNTIMSAINLYGHPITDVRTWQP